MSFFGRHGTRTGDLACVFAAGVKILTLCTIQLHIEVFAIIHFSVELDARVLAVLPSFALHARFLSVCDQIADVQHCTERKHNMSIYSPSIINLNKT